MRLTLRFEKSLIEQREVESDEDFNKNTIRFHVYLWEDRIEFSVHREDPSRWEPYVTLLLDANDTQLGQAPRQTYQHHLLLKDRVLLGF